MSATKASPDAPRPYAGAVTTGATPPPPDDDAEPDPTDQAPDDEEPTLGQILRGHPVSPATTAHLNKLLGDMNARVGKFDFAAGKVVAPTSKVAESFLQQQAEARDRAMSMENALGEGLAAQRAATQRELDWRANLLAQQQATVAALNDMATSQVADRRTNVWVLRVAIATLAVGLLGIIAAVILAIAQ